MTVRKLTIDEARRIAIRAQLLDADRPTDLVAMVRHLNLLQLDPTSVIAPNADLVSWTRIGNSYRPAQLTAALEQDRTLYEHRGQPTPFEAAIVMIRPTADLGLFRAEMSSPPKHSSVADWLRDNAGFRKRVLALLTKTGPLPSRSIPDTAERAWESTGWTHNQNVTRMLEFLQSRGDVAVAGRIGRDRTWDIAARVFPDVEVVPLEEARRIRDERWLRSQGITRPRAVGDAGIPVEVEGTVGEWRLDLAATADGFAGRTALLSPFDRLIHDRVRAVDLFDFEYTLEMYKPKDKRRWGYFALPVLHHDRLVGKVDAAADRKAGVLQVHAIHEDVRFTKPIIAAVNRELAALAAWLGLDGVRRG